MCLRRCLLGLFWLVGLLFLLRHPITAAHTTRQLLAGLAHLADVIARFATSF